MSTQNTNSNKPASTLRECGALWSRSSQKSNEKYLSAILKFPEDIKAGQEVPIIIFTNKHKKAENQPDLRAYLSDKTPQSKTAPVAKPTPKVETTSTTEELF